MSHSQDERISGCLLTNSQRVKECLCLTFTAPLCHKMAPAPHPVPIERRERARVMAEGRRESLPETKSEHRADTQADRLTDREEQRGVRMQQAENKSLFLSLKRVWKSGWEIENALPGVFFLVQRLFCYYSAVYSLFEIMRQQDVCNDVPDWAVHAHKTLSHKQTWINQQHWSCLRNVHV